MRPFEANFHNCLGNDLGALAFCMLHKCLSYVSIKQNFYKAKEKLKLCKMMLPKNYLS